MGRPKLNPLNWIRNIPEDRRQHLADRLDHVIAILGAITPCGIVFGNLVFESAVGLAGFLWISRSVLARDNPLGRMLKNPVTLTWTLWYAAVVAAMIYNGPGSKGAMHDVVFIRFLLFVMALTDVGMRRPIGKYLAIGLGAGVMLAAANTTTAYLMGQDLIGKPLTRYTEKLKEASRISGIAAYAAPFFLAWGLFDKSASANRRVLGMVIGVLAFAQVMQTRVRTSILGALAGLIFATLYYNRKRLTKKVLAILGGAVVAVAAFFFAAHKMWDLTSLYDRVYFWKVAWFIFNENPVLGVGVSSFQDIFAQVAQSGQVAGFVAPTGRVFMAAEQTHAHNLFFMLLACTGAVGTLAFLLLFSSATVRVFKDHAAIRTGLIAFPVVLVVIGLTGFNIFHSWYQALVAFFMIFAAAPSAFSEPEFESPTSRDEEEDHAPVA